jgi:hypothetical protein
MVQTPKPPRFWPEMKTCRGLGCVVAAVALIDVDSVDLAAGERLGLPDHAPECMPIILFARAAP